MANLFKKMWAGYENYALKLGRKRACEVLRGYNDRQLEDMGFSRELLENGESHWPWKIDSVSKIQAAATNELKQRQAARELNSFSDTELRDIGVTRGSIDEVVRYGREGIEYDQIGKVA